MSVERMTAIAFSVSGVVFARSLTEHEARLFDEPGDWAAVRYVTRTTASSDDERMWLKVKRSWYAAAIAVQLIPGPDLGLVIRGLNYIKERGNFLGIQSGLPNFNDSVGRHVEFLDSMIDVGYCRGDLLGPSASIPFNADLIGFGNGVAGRKSVGGEP